MEDVFNEDLFSDVGRKGREWRRRRRTSSAKREKGKEVVLTDEEKGKEEGEVEGLRATTRER